MKRIRGPHLGWLAFLVIVLILPRIVGIIHVNLAVDLAISALFAVSLNLLLSYTGLFSFGHALFFGTGAYATALLLRHVDGVGLVSALLMGGLSSALLAAVCSPLLVRATGKAFAMLTLALGQLMFVACLKFREVTGGEDGISGFPIPALSIPGIGPIDMVDPVNFYFFALTVVITCVWLMWFVTRTPFGSLMVAIRDNPDRIAYLGFKVAHTKAVVFTVSGGFAGIAGSLFALFQSVVSTDGVLHLMVSFFPLLAILVGGISSFAGPIVGSGLLLLIEEWSVRFTERVELVTGLIFLLVVLFAPEGMVGLWKSLKERVLPLSHTKAAEGETA
jgi:branched-chain amino acid transport system permease protein